MASWKCKFGFLHQKVAVETKDYAITPLTDYDSTFHKLMESRSGQHIDFGYSLIPASHELVIKRNRVADPRFGLAGYIVQFLAYNYRTRLQFDNWYLSGSIPFRPRSSIVSNDNSLAIFLDKAIVYYLSLRLATLNRHGNRYTAKQRRNIAVNSLFVLCQSAANCYEGERMSLAWTSLDAMLALTDFRLLRRKEKKYRGDHFSTAYTLSQELDIFFSMQSRKKDGRGNPFPSSAAVVLLSAKLRNNYIHQCLWDGLPPGHASKSTLPFYAGFWMHRLGERVFAALVLGPNEFSASDWTAGMDQSLPLDRP